MKQYPAASRRELIEPNGLISHSPHRDHDLSGSQGIVPNDDTSGQTSGKSLNYRQYGGGQSKQTTSSGGASNIQSNLNNSSVNFESITYSSNDKARQSLSR